MSEDTPRPYDEYSARFPGIAEGWQQLGRASREGPLDERTVAVVKLAIAIGTCLEGPVHSATRKALAAGCTLEDLEQVVALTASSLGLPRSVAAWTWIRDVTESGGDAAAD